MDYATLDELTLKIHCETLAGTDEKFAEIIDRFGIPPLWSRPEGFSTLINIILEQQVSLASARAAFDRFIQLFGEINPETVLSLSDEQMKSAYFSRQKIKYARNLANAVGEKSIDLKTLKLLSNNEIRAELMKITGIGRWTSDIYLLMALSRIDIMPKGDLALHIAWQRLMKLETRPNSEEFYDRSRQWKPLRSIAARILWHYYLNTKYAK